HFAGPFVGARKGVPQGFLCLGRSLAPAFFFPRSQPNRLVFIAGRSRRQPNRLVFITGRSRRQPNRPVIEFSVSFSAGRVKIWLVSPISMSLPGFPGADRWKSAVRSDRRAACCMLWVAITLV